jgi:glycosyltransferase involved in cell wall biosynthesis
LSLRPRRLLYVVSLFPCWSETFIAREIAALIAAGSDVQILSLRDPSERLVQPEAEGLLPRVLYPLPFAQAVRERMRALSAHPLTLLRILLHIAARLGARPHHMAKSLEALARGTEHLAFIRSFDPDVIHAHWATYPSTVAWALGRMLGKPFGFTCHANDIFVNDQLLREKIESAEVAVTISNYNVNWLTEHSTPHARHRLHVVHCGVDLAAIPFRPSSISEREPGLILAVGRLDATKGFEVLLDALALVARKGRRVRCRIVGDGPFKAEIEAAIARNGLAHVVELSGARAQADVLAALYASSIFVLPSVVTTTGDRDGIPVSLMEAMAAGTPSVSTLVSGIPELIEDGKEGFLVPERDASALAHALERLLDDPGLGERMAMAARLKVEREFDAATEARKLLNLFADASA